MLDAFRYQKASVNNVMMVTTIFFLIEINKLSLRLGLLQHIRVQVDPYDSPFGKTQLIHTIMKPFFITSVICVACSLQSCTRSDEPWRPAKSTETITTGYCVVSLVEDADPFYAAVVELQRLHNATVLKALPESLEALLPGLQATKPQYVAIVVRPESLDINLVGRFMKLATRVDEDPFIDFAYAFITGDDPQTALSLIEAGQLTDATSSPSIAMIGVMGDGMHAQSSSTLQQLPLRSGFISQAAHMIAGKKTDTCFCWPWIPA
jgi:hypothetical protein